ncbi:CheR family methyltransferase [Geobacter sp.]|uniref:CheR family methyltransferase n=1 Tax=Geobacter sp. TaxID=46610 RepID=UPI00261FC8D2|nr:CheR family methyltransferase [Geobacter sp.]
MHASDILIISGDGQLSELLAQTLAAEKCTVATARSAAEGVEAARLRPPDLIILDPAGAPASAEPVIARLQRRRETRAVPVIVVTADPVAEHELLPAFDVLPRPPDPERLRDDLAILRRRKGAFTAAPAPLDGETHRLFAEFLEAETGLHFDQRNLKLLERGLRSRMAALKLGSFTEYFDYLLRFAAARGELAKLLTFLTVGETSFFRYSHHFDALRRFIIPEIAGRREGGRKRLRIWSAGCSTGEEPYSLAITVIDALPDWREWDIAIVATDLNGASIRRAREGIYGDRTLRGAPPECLQRHFTKSDAGWRIGEEVRRLVAFGVLNLQGGRFPSSGEGEPGFDVIFCRNVMIYFDLATMERLVAKFAEALTPGGYLFLGHSESLLQLSSRFERLSHGSGFYYRRREGHGAATPRRAMPVSLPTAPFVLSREATPRPVLREPPPPPFLPAGGTGGVMPASRPPRPAPAEERPRDLFREARILFDAEEYGGAAALLDELLLSEPRHTGALLARGTIHANGGRFAEALADCAAALEADDLLPEAYLVRGLIREASGETEEAVADYRRALLLDMEAVMPHYALGRLLTRLGKNRDGERELRNAMRALERLPAGEMVPFSGGMPRETLLELLRSELV